MSVLGFDLSQANIVRALNTAADEVLLGQTGALAKNYERSGLKQRSGRLFRAITSRGADGHYRRIEGSRVTEGIDLRVIPYAKWAIGGRGPVVAKRAKFLRFEIDGKVFYRKRVGPAPPRPVFYLTAEDDARFDDAAAAVLMGANPGGAD